MEKQSIEYYANLPGESRHLLKVKEIFKGLFLTSFVAGISLFCLYNIVHIRQRFIINQVRDYQLSDSFTKLLQATGYFFSFVFLLLFFLSLIFLIFLIYSVIKDGTTNHVKILDAGIYQDSTPILRIYCTWKDFDKISTSFPGITSIYFSNGVVEYGNLLTRQLALWKLMPRFFIPISQFRDWPDGRLGEEVRSKLGLEE